MIEFTQITEKYQPPYIEKHFSSLEGLHMFSVQFFKDVAGIYDVLTRMRNIERNPTGYSIDDAPILVLICKHRPGTGAATLPCLHADIRLGIRSRRVLLLRPIRRIVGLSRQSATLPDKYMGNINAR